jgi:LysM repeat protein
MTHDRPGFLGSWWAMYAFVLAAVTLAASPAQAQQQLVDGQYVIGRGETLSEIAQRLGVTTRALAEHNHLEAPYALRTGRRLRLPPTVTDDVIRQLGGRPAARTNVTAANATRAGTTPPNRGRVQPNAPRAGSGGGRWGRPAARGYVRLVRESSGMSMGLHMRRITPSVLGRMRAFLRFADGRSHPINARLLRQLAVVSDHFGGRRVHVISGFRPFRRGQWTPHSNHNVGRAMDFRVEGVPNRVLRDFCRTLPQTGCGYYPRSVFVHMDVREESAYWVDWSRPGQRPQYGREDRPPENGHAPAGNNTAVAQRSGEDEGVDDVAQDNAGVRTATAVEEHDDDARAQREGSSATPAPEGAQPAPTNGGAPANNNNNGGSTGAATVPSAR